MVKTRRAKRQATETPTNGLECNETCTSSECPICLLKIDAQSQVSSLLCGHTFHSACIVQALQWDRRCPLCRHKPQANTADAVINEGLDTDEGHEHDDEWVEHVVGIRVLKLQPATLRLIARDMNVREGPTLGLSELRDVVTEQLCNETDDEDE